MVYKAGIWFNASWFQIRYMVLKKVYSLKEGICLIKNVYGLTIPGLKEGI